MARDRADRGGQYSVRSLLSVAHRWAGLTIAVFLFVAGVTGAIVSWDHELDDLLNPHLMNAVASGPAIPSLELARQVEARDPRIVVADIPLVLEEGKSLALWVEPRVDPTTGRLYEPGYNQVFLDPATGTELGRREWGAVWPLSTENFVSFLYVLHYSLHIPRMWGIDMWGLWFMGVIALLWTIDCFIGFYLTLPARRERRANRAAIVEQQLARGFWARWAPAWRIKTSGSIYRINFDIHRAFGLWLWLLLFILAVSAASLNLNREVAQPLVTLFSSFTPTPFDTRTPRAEENPIAPGQSFETIFESARSEANRRGWTPPAGSIFYSQSYGVFGVTFYEPGDDHGAAGVGNPELFYDGGDGQFIGDFVPWRGTAGDLFLQVQFPLHSGRIAGVPGRILISFMGLVVAALSVTGVVIWYRKRIARLRRTAKGTASAETLQPEIPAAAE